MKELLGQGGFGRVYRAYDPQLDRDVALKVPLFGPEDKHKVQRFHTEARSAARLRHPNIVTTYESGESGGRYYLVTQFVNGETLSKRMKAVRTGMHQAAAWIRDLAEALAYAHSEGIVHRDIKPENIMLDEKGRPQLMDFGLAKRIHEDASITTDGTILGTPAYMSPEQARGELTSVGPASDQYSLGAVLYELLTGRRPFDGPPHAVIAQVASQEPPALRSLEPQIPKDLEAICQKAMNKEAEHRYASLEELANDLASWLRGDETSARPIRMWERILRWRRRNPLVAGLAAAIVLLTIVAIAAISAGLVVADAARQRAELAQRGAETSASIALREQKRTKSALAEAQRERAKAESNLALANQRQKEAERAQKQALAKAKEAQDALQQAAKSDAGQAAALERAKEAEAQAVAALQRVEAETARAQRLLAQTYLDLGIRLCQEGKTNHGMLWLAKCLQTTPAGAEDLAVAARANLAEYLGGSGSTQQAAPQLRATLAHESAVTAASYSPDADWLVSGDEQGQLHVWNALKGDLVKSQAAHTGRIQTIIFSPVDAAEFISASVDHTAVLWTIGADGGLNKSHTLSHDGAVIAVSYSNDGQRVLTGEADSRVVRLWSPQTGRSIGSAFGRDDNIGQVRSLAFFPAVDRANKTRALALLASGGLERSLRIWDVSLRKPVSDRLSFSADPLFVVHHPRRPLALVGTEDKRAWLVDSSKMQLLAAEPLAHQGPVVAAAFSPDQRTVLTGSQDRTAQLWSLETRRPMGDALLHAEAVTAVGFSLDGLEFFTAGEDKVIRLWRMPLGYGNRASIECPGPVDTLALSPSGGRLVVTSGRDAWLLNVATGAIVAEMRDKTQAITSVCFSSDGKWLLVGDAVEGRLWNSRTLKPFGAGMPHAGRVLCGCFSDDGTHVATASEDGTAKVWDAKSQELVATLTHPDAVTSIMLAADGKLVATGCADGKLRLWMMESVVEPVKLLDAKSPIHSVAIAERLVAAGTDNGTVTVWDIQSGKTAVPPLSHGGAARKVHIDAAGRVLTVGSRDGVRSWDLATGREIGSAVTLGGEVDAMGVGKVDGILVASSTEQAPKMVRVWRRTSAADATPEVVAIQVSLMTGLRLEASGAVTPLTTTETEPLRQRLQELNVSVPTR